MAQTPPRRLCDYLADLRGLLADLCPPIRFFPETCQKAQELLSAPPSSGPSVLLAKCEGHLKMLADPRYWFDVAICEEIAIGTERKKAIQKVQGDDPTLHKAYLLAMNPNPDAQRQIEDRFRVYVDAADKGKYRIFSGDTIKGLVAELRGLAEMCVSNGNSVTCSGRSTPKGKITAPPADAKLNTQVTALRRLYAAYIGILRATGKYDPLVLPAAPPPPSGDGLPLPRLYELLDEAQVGLRATGYSVPTTWQSAHPNDFVKVALEVWGDVRDAEGKLLLAERAEQRDGKRCPYLLSDLRADLIQDRHYKKNAAGCCDPEGGKRRAANFATLSVQRLEIICKARKDEFSAAALEALCAEAALAQHKTLDEILELDVERGVSLLQAVSAQGNVYGYSRQAPKSEAMVSLQDDRVRHLYQEFLSAANQFPHVQFAAVTGKDGSDQIPQEAWCGLLDAPLGCPRFFDIRIDVGGKSWLAGCYTHSRYWDSLLPECYDNANAAVAELDRLARKAGSHFHAGPSPLPPDDLVRRWLETVLGMPFVSSQSRCDFLIREVAEDIFTASARAIEVLTKPRQGEVTADASPLPRSIQEIPDPELRWQAGRTWQGATDLLDCIEQSHCLIERFETGAEASLPEWGRLYEKAGRAANTLCDTGAVAEGVTPIEIIAAFPKPPNPVASWQKQYDIDQARAKKGPLSHLAAQLAAMRTQAETCPKTLLTPSTLKPETSKEKGGTGSPPKQPPPDSNVKRREVLAGLQPADRKAYLSYQYAETMAERRLEDREAHDWLKENGIDAGKGDVGELDSYELPPNYETWRRQVSEARRLLGEQKYTPRKGRSTGRSIVSGQEIEYRGPESH